MGWNLIRFCKSIDGEPRYLYEFYDGKKWLFLGYNLEDIIKYEENINWAAITLDELEQECNKKYPYASVFYLNTTIAHIKVFGGRKEVIEELKNFETLRDII